MNWRKSTRKFSCCDEGELRIHTSWDEYSIGTYRKSTKVVWMCSSIVSQYPVIHFLWRTLLFWRKIVTLLIFLRTKKNTSGPQYTKFFTHQSKSNNISYQFNSKEHHDFVIGPCESWTTSKLIKKTSKNVQRNFFFLWGTKPVEKMVWVWSIAIATTSAVCDRNDFINVPSWPSQI